VNEKAAISAPAENTAPTTPPAVSWRRVVFSLLLSGLALWALTRSLDWADVTAALLAANHAYTLLGTAVILLTLLLKAQRWQMLFHPDQRQARWRPAFSAMMLGQLFNLLIPVRVGDLARIYTFHQETGIGKARALGTLVVEKLVDLLMLAATLFLLLPFLVIPELSQHRGVLLTAVAGTGCLILYLLAYQTRPIINLLRRLAAKLPTAVGQRIMNLIVAGLQGLSALRSRRMTFLLLLNSAVIAFLAVLTPWTLFPAFGLELGLKEAAILHLVLTAGLTPPSTPGKILIFEGLVVFTLQQLGQSDNAILLSYAILFHLVVMLPQIILGSLAAVTSKWDWRQPAPSQPPPDLS
jgi:glycosyltransferase 2 family protein